jgi:uncharacterized protein involved in cysteine biosynthesis
MPLEGIRLIFAHAELLRLAVLPACITLAVSFCSLMAAWRWGGALLERLWERPVACSDCSWYLWSWTRLEVAGWSLAWLVGILLASLLAALLTSRVALVLVMDRLADASLKRLGVTARSQLPVSMTTQLGRALARSLVLLLGYLLLGALWLIPGAAMVATPLSLAWTLGWLYVDTCSYALQCLGPARLSDLAAIVRMRPWLAAGFLLALGVITLIPLAGLVATPTLVVGGCVYLGALQLEDAPRRELAPVALSS